MNTQQNLEAKATFFKALGHPVRLLILNLVGSKPRHGEELAAILNLKPATISHHLGKLNEAGLVDAQKDQYYQMYTLRTVLLQQPLADMIHLPQPGLAQSVEEDAYRAKVLKTFFRNGRLTHIPAQLKKRVIILEKLVTELEPDHAYHELELNQILKEFHDDVATLRREMVGHGLLTRERNTYWRP